MADALTNIKENQTLFLKNSNETYVMETHIVPINNLTIKYFFFNSCFFLKTKKSRSSSYEKIFFSSGNLTLKNDQTLILTDLEISFANTTSICRFCLKSSLLFQIKVLLNKTKIFY